MPHRLALEQMADEIRRNRLACRELVEAHLRQIERHNPKLNAFVEVFAEEARAAARAADEAAARGQWLGRLHGVPLTVKDSFDVAGRPTYCGSRFRLSHRAAQDATAVARLRQAGAILLGKTNCPEFLANYETDNHITGRTNNPWDLARTSGGSSGGEAALIAARCSAGGLGSDGGGSIRIPAHFCGIAGLKPTPGRVSAAGHFPLINHPGGLLGVGGPMARTAVDVRLLFEETAGYDPDDPFSAPVPLRRPDLAGLRIGLLEQLHGVPVQAAVRSAVQQTAVLLERLGFPLEPFQPRGLERAHELWWFFFTELNAPAIRRLVTGREEEAHWTGTELFSRVWDQPEPTAGRVLENLAARDAMRTALLRQMQGFPVLLAPACGVVAFHHRERRWLAGERWIDLLEAMTPVTFANLLGLPALVIPVSLSGEGIPAGVQLIGRPYEEELLLEVAVRIEETRGPFSAPPGSLD